MWISASTSRLVAPSTLLDFYRADLDYWLAIGVVRDVADNFLRLRPPRLNKCVDGLEVKMTQGEISRRRARNGPSNTLPITAVPYVRGLEPVDLLLFSVKAYDTVTGSAGRIGQAVVAELNVGPAGRGFDRRADAGLGDRAGRRPHRRRRRPPRDARAAGTVIHLAATPDDDDFLTKLLPNNIVGVYHVLEAARLAGVRRLVLASSGQVVWWQRETRALADPADTTRRRRALVRGGQGVPGGGRPGLRRVATA